MLTVAVTALPAGPAQAQGAERQRRDEKRAARVHYERGRVHHEHHEYDQAVREYLLAYELQPSAGLLFNIAQAYLLAGDRDKALENYQAYLRQEPEGEVSDLARQRIAEIEEAMAAESLEVPPAAPEQPAGQGPDASQGPAAGRAAPGAEPRADSAPAGSPGSGLRWTGLAVAGVGLVGLGLGVKFGLDASDVQDRIESQPEGTPWTFDDLYAEGQAASRNMWISYGVGGAALIAGGTLYFLGLKSGSSGERPLAIVPVWDRSGSGLVLVGGF